MKEYSLADTISSSDFSNIRLNDEFLKAIDLFTAGNNLFITGVAGTGKSTLLSIFQGISQKNTVVLAPTGVAALNVGGSTIHSFFKFPIRIVEKEDIKVSRSRANLCKKIDVIIIDEISMVRADVLDGIDYYLKIHRENDLPFGGVQMVFFGDILQLPPVVNGRDVIDYFNTVYGGPYFFNAQSFSTDVFTFFELHKIFRQKDKEFQDILNAVRESRVSSSDISLLNSRYVKEEGTDSPETTDGITITLCSTNKIAAEINTNKLNVLTTPQYTYEATVSGKFEKSSFPTDSVLTLKVGTQVMMVKNDPMRRWVNGTIGIITGLSDEVIQVNIEGNTYSLSPTKWEVIEYKFNKEINKIDSEVIGTFEQYPVKMAWAITIHKSQGKTFNNVIINLGGGAFSPGQTYVALSRCRTLDGITLQTKISRRDIIVDRKVLNFIAELKKKMN